MSNSLGTVTFDLKDGKQLWQSQANTGRTYTYPATANQNIIIIAGNYVSAHELKTGKLLWRIPVPERSLSLAFLDNNQLYTVFDNEIRGYDLETGELLWKSSGSWSPWSGVFYNGVLYLDHSGGIGAFDVTMKQPLWVEEKINVSSNSMSIQDELLLVGVEDQHPVALRLGVGQIAWEAREIPEADLYQKPLAVEGTVYVRGLFANRLYAYSLKDGSLIGYLQLGRSQQFSLVTNAEYPQGPIYTGDFIVFPVKNVLYAYGP